ncbi:response regulator [Flavobacterium sp. LB1P62]|uniref:response regulator n=1 Tax=unclassified Flavobacterium TaxID=196869 RepID=UPI003AAD1F14
MTYNQTPLQIFLADDDDDERIIFSEAIEELKMKNELTFFNDGNHLLSYLFGPDSNLPDILFLDLNMPYKNGLDCLKEIRAVNRFKDVSIAIYSTSSSEEDIENTFIGGANIYIKKPNDFSEMKVIKGVFQMNWQYHTLGLNKETFFFII